MAMFLVDRVKELIKYMAYQVAPAELEALLVAHPAVADAAVVPKPDVRAGEIPKAYVVPAHRSDPDELMAYVAERVAPHKTVREVEFVDEIPKSATGKILGPPVEGVGAGRVGGRKPAGERADGISSARRFLPDQHL